MSRNRTGRVLAATLTMVLAWTIVDVSSSGPLGAALTSSDGVGLTSEDADDDGESGLPTLGSGLDTGPVEEGLSTVAGEVERLLGPLPGQGDDEGTGDPEPDPPVDPEPVPPDDDPGADPEPEEDGRIADDLDTKPGDSDADSDEADAPEEAHSVPPGVERGLQMTREFGGLPDAEPIDPGSFSLFPVPEFVRDFVDVPLGARSSRDIVERLLAMGATQADVARVLAPYPVAGPSSYSNDWGVPRHVPSFHRHEGTDLFASRGTPVISSSGGTVVRVGNNTAIGGNSVSIVSEEGTRYYYAHLDEIAAGIRQGVKVRLGQEIGTVGTTGNARGGLPHLHYEIHPGDNGPVPPLPYLDRWLVEARQEVATMQAGGGGGAPVSAGSSFEATAPGILVPRSAQLIEPAAATSSPVAASITLLLMVVGGAVAIRRRVTYGHVLPEFVWRRLEERRQARVAHLLPFPLEALRRAEKAPGRVDVLEALLHDDEGSDDREPAGTKQ